MKVLKELLSEGGIPKLELLVIKLVFSSIIRLKTELKGLRKYISLLRR